MENCPDFSHKARLHHPISGGGRLRFTKKLSELRQDHHFEFYLRLRVGKLSRTLPELGISFSMGHSIGRVR